MHKVIVWLILALVSLALGDIDVQALLTKAKAGDLKAQWAIANCYLVGNGVEKSEKKSFYWLKKSAEQGDFWSQFHLAIRYENGEGTLKDTRKAFYWYRESARNGCSLAMNSTALNYEYGTGVEKDIKKAIYWHEKTAKKLNTYLPYFIIGQLYFRGDGIVKDYKKAKEYIHKAYNQEKDPKTASQAEEFWNKHELWKY